MFTDGVVVFGFTDVLCLDMFQRDVCLNVPYLLLK